MVAVTVAVEAVDAAEAVEAAEAAVAALNGGVLLISSHGTLFAHAPFRTGCPKSRKKGKTIGLLFVDDPELRLFTITVTVHRTKCTRRNFGWEWQGGSSWAQQLSRE